MLLLLFVGCAAAGAMRDEAFVEKANGFGGKVQRTFSGERATGTSAQCISTSCQLHQH
jgi:hypothetical protein